MRDEDLHGSRNPERHGLQWALRRHFQPRRCSVHDGHGREPVFNNPLLQNALEEASEVLELLFEATKQRIQGPHSENA